MSPAGGANGKKSPLTIAKALDIAPKGKVYSGLAVVPATLAAHGKEPV
jgi:hypothetical protein